MSFPRYPKYKDSGVEWLGEVPQHWEVMPIRFAARLESGHTPSRNHPEYWDDCTVPWFSLADVWQIREEGRSVIYETKEKISELGIKNSAARRLPAGTVMLSRTASVGFAAIMGVEMATTQDFANWVCGSRLQPKFLLSVFRAMRGEFQRLMMGSTHNTIYMPDIQAFRFVLPSLPEQTAIAAFLDRETAKIDALVAEQERLIELLKEKRQAVISHAVTKGLNPDAPMKDSGVEWLGEIPAHWEVMRLARKATIENGTTPSKDNLDYWADGDIAWLASGEVNQVRITECTTFITRLACVECSLRLFPKGTIVVGLIGQGRTRGLAALLEIDACINQNLAGIVTSTELAAEYLLYLLQTAYEYLREFGRGGNQAALNCEILAALRMPIPPIVEQTRIAEQIRSRCTRFDALIVEAQRAIELLQERRTALISAAVTGQIDVRDVERRAA